MPDVALMSSWRCCLQHPHLTLQGTQTWWAELPSCAHIHLLQCPSCASVWKINCFSLSLHLPNYIQVLDLFPHKLPHFILLCTTCRYQEVESKCRKCYYDARICCHIRLRLVQTGGTGLPGLLAVAANASRWKQPCTNQNRRKSFYICFSGADLRLKRKQTLTALRIKQNKQ